MKSTDRSLRIVRVAVLAVVSAIVAASAARAQVYEIVYDFAIEPVFNVESNPHGPLTRGSDGNFYGTTFNSFLIPDEGTAFRFNARGIGNNLVVLHNFTADADGYHPETPLLESSGYLFGSVSRNNSCLSEEKGDESVYRMDFIGNLATIACYPSTPDMSGLVAAYGGMWGIDPVFSDVSLGLFRMETSGDVTSQTALHDGRRGGLVGTGELLLASDGNLYGLAANDGAGVLFRSDSAGIVTTLHTFAGGDNPFGRLVEQGGFLWGTTTNGGDFGLGTMFRMDFNGGFATLHSFTGGVGDGAAPTGGLLVANNSSFYGTTKAGGQYNAGTLYQIDSFGNVVILHSFGDIGDGSNPGPLLAVNGVLWGTTQSGGASGGGTIYVLIPSFTTAVLRLTPTAGPVLVRPGDPVQIHGGVFPVGEVPSVMIGGLPASNVQLLDQENLSAATPPGLSPGTLNEIIIVMPDGTQASLENAWMADFLDVPLSDRLHGSVERVFRAGLMDGCGGGNFCEGNPVDRGTMVVMALKAKHGPAWAPPACTGTFKDVPCPGPDADWIEAAVAEGIAQPCARKKFCPSTDLTRETIPDLLLKTEHGSDYVPPTCTGIFKDVKCPGPHADAIEQVYNEGVVEACSTNPRSYCPKRRANRGSVAEYEVKAYRLP